MESVEEIPFLQTDLEKFCVLIASVTSCGCNGLLVERMISNPILFGTGSLACQYVGFHWCFFIGQGLGVYASGVLCLGMWSELYRRLHTRWVVTERSNRGSDAFTNNVIKRWVFPLRYKFIRGQEDRTSVPVVTGVCWDFRLDNINSIGFVLPQVKFMDVKLVCVMDLYRGIYQELEYFVYNNILYIVICVCVSLGYAESLLRSCLMICYWLRRWANAIGQRRRWFNRAESGSYTMVFGKGLSQYAEIQNFNQNTRLIPYAWCTCGWKVIFVKVTIIGRWFILVFFK